MGEFAKIEKELFSGLVARGYHPKVIYDIGASNGHWSEIMASVFTGAQFELFEPLVDFPEYSSVHEKSPRPWGRLHAIALGSQDTEAEMSVWVDGFSSTLIPMGDLSGIARRQLVPVRRLDSYVIDANLPPPNVVKMDVQGFEACVIEGGRDTIARADITLIETWLYRGYGPATPLLAEIVDTMGYLGFDLVEFGHIDYQDISHKLISVDAFFMKPNFVTSISGSGPPWRLERTRAE